MGPWAHEHRKCSLLRWLTSRRRRRLFQTSPCPLRPAQSRMPNWAGPPRSLYPFISQGGQICKMFRSLKLKMAETESFNQRNAPRLTGGTPATRPRMTAICRPAEVPPRRATHRIPLIARRPLFRGRLAGPKHALLRQVVPDSTWMAI